MPSYPVTYVVPRDGRAQRVTVASRDELRVLRTELELLRRIRRKRKRRFRKRRGRASPDLTPQQRRELEQVVDDACHPLVNSSIKMIDREFPEVRKEIVMSVINEEADKIVEAAAARTADAESASETASSVGSRDVGGVLVDDSVDEALAEAEAHLNALSAMVDEESSATEASDLQALEALETECDAAVQADGVAEDALPEGAASEDVVPDDAVSGDVVPDDAASADVVPPDSTSAQTAPRDLDPPAESEDASGPVACESTSEASIAESDGTAESNTGGVCVDTETQPAPDVQESVQATTAIEDEPTPIVSEQTGGVDATCTVPDTVADSGPVVSEPTPAAACGVSEEDIGESGPVDEAAASAVATIEAGLRKLGQVLTDEVNERWRSARTALDEIVILKDRMEQTAAHSQGVADELIRVRDELSIHRDEADIYRREATHFRDDARRAKERAEASAKAAEISADQAAREAEVHLADVVKPDHADSPSRGSSTSPTKPFYHY